MRKNNLVCMALMFVSMLFVACTAIDVSNFGAGQQDDSVAQASSSVVSGAVDESSESDSATTGGSASDSEFYYEELKENEKKEVDLGNDGKMDTILLELKDGGECHFNVNDKSVVDIDLPVEGGLLYGHASALFVHRSDGDYIILEITGESHYGSVNLYKWNNGALENLGGIEEHLSRVQFDEKNGTKTYGIDANEVIIETRYDILGSWKSKKNFTYGSNGFNTLDWKHNPLEPLAEGGETGFILKKSVTFKDDSGEEPNTAQEGQKIYPCDLYQGWVGFKSEDGKFLGYLNCTYNKEDFRYYIDGVSEEEIFENNLYIG